MGLSSNQAMFAYLFSLSAARYTIDTHGMYRIKSVLEELGSGSDSAVAIDRGISISYEDLDQGWKRSLE